MKNNILRIIGAVIIISTVACIQEVFAQKKKKDSTEPKEVNSLLWKISGKNLSRPSYLFGTIHMICKDAYFWTDAMQKAFDDTEKVCMEMDLDDPMLQMQVASKLMLQDGKTLKDLFSEEEYNQVGSYLSDNYGMDIKMFNQMRPVALLMVLTQNSMACDNDNVESYEMNLMKMAQEGNKEILGLETADDQIKALESLLQDSVISYLVKYVNGEAASSSDVMKELSDAYTTQNLETIQRLMATMESETGNMRGLLEDRNKNWIPKLEEMMKANAVFFGVGAGHLPGNEGVIELLRKAGYKVEPVL